MKTSTLVDTNILIDVLNPDAAEMRSRSLAALKDGLDRGAVVFSAIMWAALSISSMTEDTSWSLFAWLRPTREPFSFRAAFVGGQAHRLYRDRGGKRDRTRPDFLIGAHALVGGHRWPRWKTLLTRDPARYRSYFPALDIISPETHP